MKTVYEKGAIKIFENGKAYCLVYEKSYCQGSCAHPDDLEELETLQDYEEAYSRLDEKMLTIEDNIYEENEEDEYSEWYHNNVTSGYDEVFGLDTLCVDFGDYVESVYVIKFDIDLNDFNIEDVERIYVSKHKTHSETRKRKKELIVETKEEDFSYSY